MAKRKGQILWVGTDHVGKSGAADGRVFRCTAHPTAGGADDGTFRANGLAWHAQQGECDVAADFLEIPVEQRIRGAASRGKRSPEEVRAAMVAAARRRALGE